MKRWIPFIALCLAIVFLLGLENGSIAELDRIQTYGDIKIFTQTTIAVVNSDLGVTINGEKKNYSAAVIETLDDDFIHVGLAVANKGFDDGSYGAVVVFPSDVSTKIWSFNSKQPEKVQLEFRVNPNLSETDYIEVYMKILDLQHSINTTLASTYVSSIYQQFQLAQDQVNGVFKNDQSDLSALSIVKLTDFTASFDFDELPDIPLEPAPADTESYFLSVTGFANDVSNRYLSSYGMASNRYLWMREGLFRLTDGFPRQEDDWLSDLSDWTTISVEYGERLDEYAVAVRDHEDELVAWYLENVEWSEALRQYQEDVATWHENLRNWFGDAEDWYEEYQAYLEAARAYMAEVIEYRNELEGIVDDVMDEIDDWITELLGYSGTLQGLYEACEGATEDFNKRAGLFNPILGILNQRQSDLDEWKTELGERQDVVQSIARDLQALTEKPDDTELTPEEYEVAMEAWYAELKNLSDNLVDLSALPPLTDYPNRLRSLDEELRDYVNTPG